MLWKDRILSAVIAVCAVGLLTLGVTRLFPAAPSHAAVEAGIDITEAVTGVRPDRIVASVDGNGAEAELLTYWIGTYANYINDYLGMDVESSWDTEVEDGATLSEMVLEEAQTVLKQQLVLENLCEQYGAALSAEDEKALADQRAAYIERTGGEDAYRAELYKLGISEAGYDRLSRSDFLYAALLKSFSTPGSPLYLSDEDLADRAAQEGWITADHILFSTVDRESGAPLGDEEKAEKREQAEDVLRQLRDSADPLGLFTRLADEYSEDPGHEAYPQGYTFTHGTMVEQFDSAARALGENEYSDLVESDYGYHIILRRPLNVQEAAESVRSDAFDRFFLEQMESAKLDVEPEAERFDVPALYAALRAAQSAG